MSGRRVGPDDVARWVVLLSFFAYGGFIFGMMLVALIADSLR